MQSLRRCCVVLCGVVVVVVRVQVLGLVLNSCFDGELAGVEVVVVIRLRRSLSHLSPLNDLTDFRPATSPPALGHISPSHYHHRSPTPSVMGGNGGVNTVMTTFRALGYRIRGCAGRLEGLLIKSAGAPQRTNAILCWTEKLLIILSQTLFGSWESQPVAALRLEVALGASEPSIMGG